jgi:glycosyltransferase involved in cell wall biosynthesis
MLKHFPDFNELWMVDALRQKSEVLPLGLDLVSLQRCRLAEPTAGRPLILWNHRWEYDKDPETFFRAIYKLADEGLDFGLLLLGRSFRNEPEEFLAAREWLSDRILHFGFARDRSVYGRRLWEADIVVSTALHDFFGAAVAEACYCGCFPILPRDLAYVELLPVDHHERCLYDDFEGLLENLRNAIAAVDTIRSFSLTDEMSRFDWRRMAPIYDERLEKLAARGVPG